MPPPFLESRDDRRIGLVFYHLDVVSPDRGGNRDIDRGLLAPYFFELFHQFFTAFFSIM